MPLPPLPTLSLSVSLTLPAQQLRARVPCLPALFVCKHTSHRNLNGICLACCAMRCGGEQEGQAGATPVRALTATRVTRAHMRSEMGDGWVSSGQLECEVRVMKVSLSKNR